MLAILLLGATATPARADGGQGGINGFFLNMQPGGAGGTGFTGNPGGDNTQLNGSGGGGAGGGNGGVSLRLCIPSCVLGGAGGTALSSNGQAGDSTAAGADGGGGGYNGNGFGASTINFGANTSLTGGNGGNGGDGDSGGGGGGAGGYGAIVTGGGSNTNSGVITGGTGGAGGSSSESGGGGGDGGVGVQFAASSATLTNSGTIAGGNGGVGGAAPPAIVGTGGPGPEGRGGSGIAGADIAIVNTGTISGGLGGDGVTRANAITFTGGINSLTLQAGSTIIGNVAAFSSADTLALGGDTNSSFDLSAIGAGAQYQGFGFFQKTGSSIWTLTGSSTATTPWTINGGALQLGDASNPSTIVTGAVNVASGGTLGGYGTIIGNVANMAGGNVSPGDGIGTLTMTGNYSQSPSATTTIELNPANASKLVISGAASLGGTLRLVYNPGTYSSHVYSIIQAGSVSGGFSNITTAGSAPADLVQSVIYSPTNVAVALSSISVSEAAPVSSDVSAISVGGFAATDDEVFDHLDAIGDSSDSIKTALASAAPMKLAFNGTTEQVAQLGARLPNALAQNGGWVRGIGHFQSAHGEGAIPGYSAAGGGFLAGLDHAFGAWTIGLAGGYSGTNLKQQDGSTGNVDTPRFMIYAHSMLLPQVPFDAIIGVAFDDIHTSRPISVLGTNAVESHRGVEENFALQAGYVMDYRDFAIAPRFGVQYLHLTQQGYSESGGSGFDLTAPASHSDSFQPTVGINVSKHFAAGGVELTPEMRIAYSRELLTTSQILPLTTPFGSVLPASTVTPARNTLTLGPELTAQMTDQLSLYADYKLAIGIGRSLDHVIFGGARWEF